MGQALAAFAHDEHDDATHRVALVLDEAGWHKARNLVVPEGIDLTFLPPYSPELQPVDHLWASIDEPIANRAFPDLTALEAVLIPRCATFRAATKTIQAHSRFHWWLADLPDTTTP